MRVLAIDPGAIYGWAYAEHGILEVCGAARDVPEIPLFTPDVLVIERPHGGHGIASRANLVTLARRMERAIANFPSAGVVEFEPSQWKRSVKKTIMTRRILSRWMNDHERAVLHAAHIAPSIVHNTIDAIGLMIYFEKTQGRR